ncbi:sensor histidine kinase [Streptomyces justiciae]|uniref:histidine kinase n=1 Tax=Streptomyces justiciae TaxID=2780140 RepID=A0ABU3M5C8_9ACTN|nr:sensor histidine kinase [Streptomyces justiciae]MDT7846722.1 sensor histidine kinase [Streptomyces justiciae]
MIDNLKRYLHCRRRAVDAALAVVLLCACSFPASTLTFPGHDLALPWWPGFLLSGVSCAVLLGRRTRPRTAVAVALGCATAAVGLGYLVTPLLLGPLMVAQFSLAVRTGRKTANTLAFTGVTLLTSTALIAGPAYGPLVVKLLGPAFWLLLPTSAGTVNRLHRACLEAERARAEHAERVRDEEARHRVTEERLRIARDLHDVVAHHLVLTKVQAEAVARFVRTRPDDAERLAAELTGTATSALRELKATVGLLRDANGPEEPREAVVSLSRLSGLAASFEGAGLSVSVTEEGQPRRLAAGAGLAAHRIVQEALTNVTKHAATRSAEVRLAYTGDRLIVTVTNDGVREHGDHPFPNGGFGLTGMRERARSAGGRLLAGPRPLGGFEVVAELPLLGDAVDASARS